jgi:lactoylglutathione lyase
MVEPNTLYLAGFSAATKATLWSGLLLAHRSNSLGESAEVLAICFPSNPVRLSVACDHGAGMTQSVPIGGLFETHLTVSDLSRSVAFYRDVVGLPLALEVPDRSAAFFWIGVPGEAMLGLWSLGSAPMGLSLHVAFKASLEDVMDACDRLRARGVTPLSFFATETTEPSVIGWMPAAAVYFRDPDGHLLEYLAMLDEEPRPDRGIVPWSQWAS